MEKGMEKERWKQSVEMSKIVFEELLKWAAERGITDSGKPNSSCIGHCLSVSYYPNAGGRGLGAVHDLRKGELVLRVPKSALLTSESVSEDKKFLAAVQKHRCLSSSQILSVGLLYEISKGKSSRWYPYLVRLPRSYDTLATFGQFEMQALQVQFLVEDAIWTAEKAASKAKFDWKGARALMGELEFKPQLLSFKAWLWASATVSTRALHIPWDDAGCLCPVGDLFNYAAPGGEIHGSEDEEPHNLSLHSRSSQNVASTDEFDIDQYDGQLQRLTDGGFEEDIAAYCFFARENYKRGEQVLLSYGTYTNLELLEHYGFLLNDNPNDKVFIPLEPDIGALTSWPMDTMFIHHNGEPSFALLLALRLWATSPAQRKSVGHVVYSGMVLSRDNEISVMNWIAKKCRVLLNRLPTSVEADNTLLFVINKMHNSCPLLDLRIEDLVPAIGDEVRAFIKAGGLENTDANFIVPDKLKRCLERWKLAVEWRLNYKRILVDCISHCTRTINNLSCQNVPTM